MAGEYAHLRSRYLSGDIEVEEFEARLGALAQADPDAIGQCGDPLPEAPEDVRFEPGAVIPYNPIFGPPRWFSGEVQPIDHQRYPATFVERIAHSESLPPETAG